MKIHTRIETLNEINRNDWIAFHYSRYDNWTVAVWEDCQINTELGFASVQLSGIWHEWDNSLDFEVRVLEPDCTLVTKDFSGPANATSIHLLRPAS